MCGLFPCPATSSPTHTLFSVCFAGVIKENGGTVEEFYAAIKAVRLFALRDVFGRYIRFVVLLVRRA